LWPSTRFSEGYKIRMLKINGADNEGCGRSEGRPVAALEGLRLARRQDRRIGACPSLDPSQSTPTPGGKSQTLRFSGRQISRQSAWSAIGGADHGWQDNGLERGTCAPHAFWGAAESQGAAPHDSALRMSGLIDPGDRKRKTQYPLRSEFKPIA
jgi:hypothetical protein